jgi:uncharacterized membrane protein
VLSAPAAANVTPDGEVAVELSHNTKSSETVVNSTAGLGTGETQNIVASNGGRIEGPPYQPNIIFSIIPSPFESSRATPTGSNTIIHPYESLEIDIEYNGISQCNEDFTLGFMIDDEIEFGSVEFEPEGGEFEEIDKEVDISLTGNLLKNKIGETVTITPKVIEGGNPAAGGGNYCGDDNSFEPAKIHSPLKLDVPDTAFDAEIVEATVSGYGDDGMSWEFKENDPLGDQSIESGTVSSNDNGYFQESIDFTPSEYEDGVFDPPIEPLATLTDDIGGVSFVNETTMEISDGNVAANLDVPSEAATGQEVKTIITGSVNEQVDQLDWELRKNTLLGSEKIKGGTAYPENGEFQQNTTFVPSAYASGEIDVFVRVDDFDGNTSTIDIVENNPPTADINLFPTAESDTGTTRVPLKFETLLDAVDSSDDTGDISTYEWDLHYSTEDGFDPDLQTQIETHQFDLDNGDRFRTLALRVTDQYGATDLATVDIGLDEPPTADIYWSPDDPAVPPGEDSTSVTFDGGGTGNDLFGELTYNWEVPTYSGEPPEGEEDTVEMVPGTYNVTLKVSDGLMSDTTQKTIEVEEQEAANFKVSSLSTNSPITAGETLTVDAQIENTGDVSGSQTVELNVDGLGSDSTSVDLSGGESKTKTLTVETSSGDAGSYTADVSTDDDSASTDVTVEEQPDPPNLVVNSLSTNSPITAGETLSVEATIENTGDESGSQTVNLDLSGLGSDSTSVDLSGGELKTKTLTVETSSGDAGSYTAEVSTDDDTASTDVTVEEQSDPNPPNFVVNSLSTNSPVTEGETLSVDATIENTGDESGSQTVSLDLGGLGSDSTSVSLSGGESTTATLSVGTSSGDAGSYTAEVSTDDDSASTDVTVQEQSGPANFTVNVNSTNAPITAGETLSVDATIKNTGDEDSSQTVVLNVDGLGSDSVSVSLSSGESTIETLSVGTESGDAGEYTAVVETSDDSDSTPITVEEADGGEPPSLPGAENPPADPNDDGVYEDINGDGDLNIFDVQMLFDNLDTSTVQNHPSAYDFAGLENGRVEVFDVQALYNEM